MDRGLRAGVRLPDGRFLYSLVGDIDANRDSSLWESRVTGGSSGLEHVRHLLDWPGAVTLSEFTVPADGTRMVFLKRSAQRDVYIAGLGPDGAPVDPRRLTLDDRDDFLTNWTPDGRAPLLHVEPEWHARHFQAIDRFKGCRSRRFRSRRGERADGGEPGWRVAVLHRDTKGQDADSGCRQTS
jgi:hypothetical protein